MKRYIRSSSIESSVSYKDNDPRLPLIKAIENVLDIEFLGSKPGMQYSDKYNCYLEYVLSGTNTAHGKKYKLKIYQSDEPRRKNITPPPGGFSYPYQFADYRILKDIEVFLHQNYPYLSCNTSNESGSVTCEEYIPEESR